MFDIDGVIAITRGTQYEKSRPNKIVIARINEIYDNGHYVKIYTARGSKTGKDWSELTVTQLKEWGVKYNELIFGKPCCDWYIGDECLNVKDFLRLVK